MTKLNLDSKSEFVGQIVDLFEDYLDANNIRLKNTDREDAIAEGDIEPEEAAIIYGDHYDIIGDTVANDIETYSLMDKQFESLMESQEAVEDIIGSFHNLLKEGGYIKDIPKPDIETLKGDIRDTFEHWGLL